MNWRPRFRHLNAIDFGLQVLLVVVGVLVVGLWNVFTR